MERHLRGTDANGAPFVMGVYPMLADNTCSFLAADFDEGEWRRDVFAFGETCRRHKIPVAIERSRSGNGAHAWIFFEEPIPAASARRLGAFLITETMDRVPDIGFGSYDRFFPSQDSMPAGGFGNLIALPLQGLARSSGNSVFIDESCSPYLDCSTNCICLTASAQSVPEGVDRGAREGERAAGPVGAVVGGTIGGVVGGRHYVVEEHRLSYRYEGDVRVGAVLPEAGVTYYDVPPEYGVRNYRYTVVNDRPVLVEPRTRRIVEVVE